jgi:hypothetical protein
LPSVLLTENVRIGILKTVILPVVLYGREGFKTIREEHRLRMFGWKRVEVTGGWRNLHNEELHNLYTSPSVIKMKSMRLR